MTEYKQDSDGLAITPSQTIGPFPHEAWQWLVQATAARGDVPLLIEGRLLDGLGEAINDGWIEATVPGLAGLDGFQRRATDEQGRFLLSLAARPVPGAPAAYITVFARGLSLHQCTAVFLADAEGLAASPLLRQLPAERRASLLAAPAETPGRYRWDVRLQGNAAQETVFFDYR